MNCERYAIWALIVKHVLRSPFAAVKQRA